MRTQQIARLYDRYAIPVYNRLGIAAARAKGSQVWDAEGKLYLDLFPGWGTNALGHCHPAVVKAAREQVGRLIHMPNTFYNEPQARLSELLVKSSFPGKCFYVNSGAEAVEAAIKLARRFGHPDRREIVTLEQSFHGRTMGALAATGQSKNKQWFEPMLAGFRHVPMNDFGAMEKAANFQTVAIMLELVQGEGGIHIADKEYVRRLRKLCDERNMLLIFDEVSSGMGRTGSLFCFQQYGVTPDILLLAKPAAGGLPIGILVAGPRCSDIWEKASHATTFGGNPFAAAAALATLQTLKKPGFMAAARTQAAYLKKKLDDLKKKHPMVREVRGMGMMLGIELDRPGAPVVQAALKKGLLINCTQEKVLRLYPALTITRKEIDRGIKILGEALTAVRPEPVEGRTGHGSTSSP
ncbi:MAG: aspartate aminotransferase family protein [Candidatus Omnitrophica bacterium]|nr:aspartate aminotransferase family protein [Candidatus Omnitrophota bacterium]